MNKQSGCGCGSNMMPGSTRESGGAMPGASMAGASAMASGSMQQSAGSASHGMPGAARAVAGGNGAGTSNGHGTGSSGPSAPPQRRCASMDVHRRLLNTSPAYAAARARIETQAFLAKRSGRQAERAGVRRIPVVVHVVYNTAVQNLSTAQVQSQIDVLNRDFRRQKPGRIQRAGAVPTAVCRQ